MDGSRIEPPPVIKERPLILNTQFPILIVEDNVVSRKLLEKSLIKAGYTVASVENGQEAIKALDEQFYPIIITDWVMPEMDGLQLCRAIRARDNAGYIFIILLTAKDAQEDIVAGLEAGADDYLTKPINQPELVARLKSGLRILELEKSLKAANEAIRVLSITDPLTGCYNRGHMSEKLLNEISRASRYNRPFAIALCDIDHFKKVNDTYGHQAGDRVLRQFAECIRNSMRQDIDWAARYGGEEFLIAFPETDLDNATIAAERLRNCISKIQIRADDQLIRITASFGVTHYVPKEEPHEINAVIEALIHQADACLYQAKSKGRNRVEAKPMPPAVKPA